MLLLAIVLFTQCDKEEDIPPVVKCNTQVIIDQNLYDNGPDDNHHIQSMTVHGSCLEVVYLGGCDAYEMKLVASEAVRLPAIPGYDLRLSFRDSSTCEALRANTIRFDLSPLHTASSGEATLSIKDHCTINYVY